MKKERILVGLCWSLFFFLLELDQIRGWCQPPQSRRSDIARRQVLGTFLIVPAPAFADVGETIRLGASGLPGYGPTDVFFPTGFIGTWKMIRTTTSSSSDGTSTTTTLEYPIRFVLSIDDKAVLDRGFNQIEYLSALTGGEKVQTCDWTVRNPNDLRWTSTSGSRNEVKVTKRSTDYTDFVSSSEYQRITSEDGRGIPSVSARRVLTKYRVLDVNTVEGIELEYDMGAGGDPMSLSTASSGGTQLIAKSRLRLVRTM